MRGYRTTIISPHQPSSFSPAPAARSPAGCLSRARMRCNPFWWLHPPTFLPRKFRLRVLDELSHRHPHERERERERHTHTHTHRVLRATANGHEFCFVVLVFRLYYKPSLGPSNLESKRKRINRSLQISLLWSFGNFAIGLRVAWFSTVE
jgi:hypothetical protein